MMRYELSQQAAKIEVGNDWVELPIRALDTETTQAWIVPVEVRKYIGRYRARLHAGNGLYHSAIAESPFGAAWMALSQQLSGNVSPEEEPGAVRPPSPEALMPQPE